MRDWSARLEFETGVRAWSARLEYETGVRDWNVSPGVGSMKYEVEIWGILNGIPLVVAF